MFYVTALVGLVILVSVPFWQTALEQSTAWRLSRRLRDPDPAVRRTAAEGLAQLGPAASPWVIRAMRDPDAKVRLLACPLMVHTAPDIAEIPLRALKDACGDADPTVRVAAVEQLGVFMSRFALLPGASRARSGAIEEICRTLCDPSPQVRAAAGWTLFNLGPAAAPAVGALDQALDGDDKPLRVIAAEALMKIDAAATRLRVIAALSPMIGDQSMRLEHWRMVRLLVREQGEDKTAALLVPLITHHDRGTSMQAINDLVMHCPHAQILKPTFVGALTCTDGFLRDEAALFLLKHDPGLAQRALDTLAEQIVDPLDGGHVMEDLIAKMREASPDFIVPLVPAVAERLATGKNA